MRVTFTETPPVGFGISLGGANFTLEALEDHTRKDGTQTQLAVWSGNCAECGDRFVTRSSSRMAPESRRCELHRKPGVKA